MGYALRRYDTKVHTRQNLKICLLILGLLYISASGDTLHAREMSDARKMEIVYSKYAQYKVNFPEVTDISPQRAMELMRLGELIFIDTREDAEMVVSMLPKAISIEEFLSRYDELKDNMLLGYCTIGKRSGLFAREMAGRGVTIFNLRDGQLAWILEGGKVYDESGGEVRRAHIYGKQWNYVPSGYETVAFNLMERLF